MRAKLQTSSPTYGRIDTLPVLCLTVGYCELSSHCVATGLEMAPSGAIYASRADHTVGGRFALQTLLILPELEVASVT